MANLTPKQWRYHEYAKACTARGETFAIGQFGTGKWTADKMISEGLWRQAASKPWRGGFAVHYEVTAFGMTMPQEAFLYENALPAPDGEGR